MEVSNSAEKEELKLLPIVGGEVRGVWHRPNSSERERNLEELCIVLDEFKSAGINLVFAEAFYHGMALFKSELAPYHTRIAEYTYGDYPDYLSAFASEAEKRGISVLAWVQDFYVGFRENAELIVDHPDWLLITQNGEIRHTTEGQGFGGYIFLDPANENVRKYLVSLYDELLTKIPQIKGLNLDYIRYPISELSENTDTGYTETCILSFAEKFGIELDKNDLRGSVLAAINEKSLQQEWIAHRAGFVTSFVHQVRDMVDSRHEGKLISTAVFAEIDQTYNLKKQNIKVWLQNGYVDFVTPMVYFYEGQQIYDAILKLREYTRDIPCYSGLYTTYHKQTPLELDQHIEASKRAGAQGFVLFDAAKTFFEAEQDYVSFLKQKYNNG